MEGVLFGSHIQPMLGLGVREWERSQGSHGSCPSLAPRAAQMFPEPSQGVIRGGIVCIYMCVCTCMRTEIKDAQVPQCLPACLPAVKALSPPETSLTLCPKSWSQLSPRPGLSSPYPSSLTSPSTFPSLFPFQQWPLHVPTSEP